MRFALPSDKLTELWKITFFLMVKVIVRHNQNVDDMPFGDDSPYHDSSEVRRKYQKYAGARAPW